MFTNIIYFLYTKMNLSIQKQELNLLLWSAAFAIGLAVVYGLNIPKHIYGNSDVVTLDQINEDYVELSLAEHSVYGGFHRFAWSVAIGWVIFACCRGYGGIQQKITFKGKFYDNFLQLDTTSSNIMKCLH